MRQKEQAERAAEAEKLRVAEAAAQRKREEDDRRAAEARSREERRLAELRQKEEAERAAEAEKLRVAEAAAQRKRDEEAAAIQKAEAEMRAAASRLALVSPSSAAVSSANAGSVPGVPLVVPGPVAQGFSGLVADEVSRFTSDQRRIAQQRIERENRQRLGLLDEDNLPEDNPVEPLNGAFQVARLPDQAAIPPRLVPVLPELTTREDIRSAQVELKRLGCFNGATNGRLTPDTTIGLETAEKSLGSDSRPLGRLTSEVLALLKDRKDKLCTGRVDCGPGQRKERTTCIAALPPQQPTRRAKAVEEEEERPRRPQRQVPRERAEVPARQAPRPREAAPPAARPAPAAPAAPRPSINLTL